MFAMSVRLRRKFVGCAKSPRATVKADMYTESLGKVGLNPRRILLNTV